MLLPPRREAPSLPLVRAAGSTGFRHPCALLPHFCPRCARADVFFACGDVFHLGALPQGSETDGAMLPSRGQRQPMLRPSVAVRCRARCGSAYAKVVVTPGLSSPVRTVRDKGRGGRLGTSPPIARSRVRHLLSGVASPFRVSSLFLSPFRPDFGRVLPSFLHREARGGGCVCVLRFCLWKVSR